MYYIFLLVFVHFYCIILIYIYKFQKYSSIGSLNNVLRVFYNALDLSFFEAILEKCQFMIFIRKRLDVIPRVILDGIQLQTSTNI